MPNFDDSALCPDPCGSIHCRLGRVCKVTKVTVPHPLPSPPYGGEIPYENSTPDDIPTSHDSRETPDISQTSHDARQNPQGAPRTLQGGQQTAQCVCAPPGHCAGRDHPACGSDGTLYPSHCELHRVACVRGRRIVVERDQSLCQGGGTLGAAQADTTGEFMVQNGLWQY